MSSPSSFLQQLLLLFLLCLAPASARSSPTPAPFNQAYAQNNTKCLALSNQGCQACVMAGCKSCSQSSNNLGAFCFSGAPQDSPNKKYGVCQGYTVIATGGVSQSTAGTLCNEKQMSAAATIAGILGSIIPCLCCCACVFLFVRWRQQQQRSANSQWVTGDTIPGAYPPQQPYPVGMVPGTYPNQQMQAPQYGYPSPPQQQQQQQYAVYPPQAGPAGYVYSSSPASAHGQPYPPQYPAFGVASAQGPVMATEVNIVGPAVNSKQDGL